MDELLFYSNEQIYFEKTEEEEGNHWCYLKNSMDSNLFLNILTYPITAEYILYQ